MVLKVQEEKRRRQKKKGDLRELVKRLFEHGYGEGCVALEDNNGNVFILCLGERPNRKNVPVIVSPQLVKTPYGAILRLKLVVCDQMYGGNPLALEAFFDPASERDRRMWLRLASQDALNLVFVDGTGRIMDTMTTLISSNVFARNQELLNTADQYNKQHPYDFNKAKTFTIQTIPLLTPQDILTCHLNTTI